MNYIILKNIIEATIANFLCQQCQGKIAEQNVNLLGASAQWLSLEVTCPHCGTTGVVKAEVNLLAANMFQSEHGRAFLEEMMKKSNLPGGIIFTGNQAPAEPSIKDEDIMKVRDSLKNQQSMKDLFQ